MTININNHEMRDSSVSTGEFLDKERVKDKALEDEMKADPVCIAEHEMQTVILDLKLDSDSSFNLSESIRRYTDALKDKLQDQRDEYENDAFELAEESTTEEIMESLLPLVDSVIALELECHNPAYTAVYAVNTQYHSELLKASVEGVKI